MPWLVTSPVPTLSLWTSLNEAGKTNVPELKRLPLIWIAQVAVALSHLISDTYRLSATTGANEYVFSVPS